MALINIQRFRDVLVRTSVAEEAPALEVSVALDAEMSEFASGLATKADIRVLSAQFMQLHAEMRQLFAEQEARHQQQLNRLATLVLAGAAVIAAIAGALVAALG